MRGKQKLHFCCINTQKYHCKYTSFFSRKLLQLNGIKSREKGRKEYLPSVTVGIIMVWQSQLKSVNPKGIVSEITDGKKASVWIEENKHYAMTKSNTVCRSIRKRMHLSGLSRILNGGREDGKPGLLVAMVILWQILLLLCSVFCFCFLFK